MVIAQWLTSALTRRRFWIQAGFDGFVWMVAIAAATLLRYEFHFSPVAHIGVLVLGLVAVGCQIAIGRAAGLYIHRYRYGSLTEVLTAASSVIPVTAAVALLNRFVLGRLVPVSASLMASALAVLGMCGGRFTWRMWLDLLRLPDSDLAEKVLVYGAGDGGLQVITAMLGQRDGRFVPVGLLDDDPGLRNLRVRGVKVLGTRGDMARVARRTRGDDTDDRHPERDRRVDP